MSFLARITEQPLGQGHSVYRQSLLAWLWYTHGRKN